MAHALASIAVTFQQGVASVTAHLDARAKNVETADAVALVALAQLVIFAFLT